MLQLALDQTDSPEIGLERMRFLQPIVMFWMTLSRIWGEGHDSESSEEEAQGEKMLDKVGWDD
jgi:hypothetical protein